MSQQRSALIVGGAAGPDEAVAGVLQRFGFADIENVSDMAGALARLRDGHYRLVVVPLEDVDATDLAALEREVRRGRSTYVIGTAARPESELIVRAMRSGVNEFLVYPPDPTELAAALDRLLRRDSGGGEEGTAIAVYSAKGGLGTTSVAINLAYALARHDPTGRVALVDLVMGGGDVSVLLDLKPAYDLGDLATKVDRIDADLLYSLLTAREGGIWILPASERPEMVEAVDGMAVTSIVGQLRSHFAFSVFDCEHALTDRTLAVLDAAGRILLVTQLNIAALRSTQRTLELCSRLGYPDEKLCVVVNRHHTGDLVSAADAAKILEREVFFRIPNDYRTSTGAMAQGVAVGSYAANSPLAQSYTGLATRLAGSRGVGSSTNGHPRTSRFGRLFGIGRR